MKRLYLLRHAQAQGSHLDGDYARELSDQGALDASALGEAMGERGYTPDFVFCSAAKRTCMTHQSISATLSDLNTEYREDLYSGGWDVYLDIIQSASDDINSVLLIGHNPSISALAGSLALDDGSAHVNHLMMGYQPATLSVFDIAHERWASVQTHDNRVVDVIAPGSLSGL